MFSFVLIPASVHTTAGGTFSFTISLGGTHMRNVLAPCLFIQLLLEPVKVTRYK